jgi:glutaredoxin
MVTDEHICPFGIKSKDLLRRKGFDVADHELRSRQETDEFKRQHGVETTPQTFVSGRRIGGYDELRGYFGLPVKDDEERSYAPVIAIFSMSMLMALALAFSILGTVATTLVLKWFVAISMCVLAIQKLRDLDSFSNQFITYDLVAMRVVPYAYVYPLAEACVGIGMLAAAPGFIIAPVALFIGVVGAVSVIKAVYVDERELSCACVGGGSKVPLGFVSLTENLFMVGAGVWMLVA